MDARQELLDEVFTHFHDTGEWPKTSPLQVKLRALGNLEKLAAEIGHDFIFVDRSKDDERFKLTLNGFELIEGAKPEITHFLWVVRALAKQFFATGAVQQVALSDLVSELELSDVELRRLGEVVWVAPGLWSGLGRQHSGDVTMFPRKEIWYFENVQSLSEFFDVLEQANDDFRIANKPQFSPRPSATLEKRTIAPVALPVTPFIHDSRLDQLRKLISPHLDLTRLIAMCEELRTCAANDCVFATAMLTRSIINHVPPVFGVSSFAEVANNYPGTKSFRDSMHHLENSARRIADAHLHVKMRKKEDLPTFTQVDFSRDLDVLLGEIIRILS